MSSWAEEGASDSYLCVLIVHFSYHQTPDRHLGISDAPYIELILDFMHLIKDLLPHL